MLPALKLHASDIIRPNIRLLAPTILCAAHRIWRKPRNFVKCHGIPEDVTKIEVTVTVGTK